MLVSRFSVHVEAPKAHLAEETAIEVGLVALKAKYPNEYDDLVAEHGPFVAKFRNDMWIVYGTNPKGVAGGDAPVIELRERDQKVLRIYFAR